MLIKNAKEHILSGKTYEHLKTYTKWMKIFSGNNLKEMIDNKIHELNPLIKHGVSIEDL